MSIILHKKGLFYSLLLGIIIGILSIKYSYYLIFLFLTLVLIIYLTKLSYNNISFCLSIILFLKTAFTSHIKLFYYISNILTIYFSLILLLNILATKKTRFHLEILPVILILYNLLSIYLGVINNFSLRVIYVDIMQNSFFPIFYLIAKNFIKTERDILYIFRSIIYSAITGGIIFLAEVFTHYLVRDVSIYNYIFPIAIFLVLYDKNFNNLYKSFLVLFLSGVTILTQTRSAWLLMVVLIFLYYLDLKRFHIGIISLFLALLILLCISNNNICGIYIIKNSDIANSIINRFNSLKYITSSDSTLMYRINSISFIFKQNIFNIFFGSGLGSQNYIYLNRIPTLYNQLEIAPCNYLWKYGIIGVLLIYSIYFVNIKNMIIDIFITKTYSRYEKIYFILLIPYLLIGSITGLIGFNSSVIMGILIGTNWNKINKFNVTS